MRIWKSMIVISVCMIMLSACKQNSISTDTVSSDSVSNNGNQEEDKERETLYEIKEVQYLASGIEAYYPRITAGANEKKLEKLNKMITNDFNKILHIYAFDPFPETDQKENDNSVVILHINYEVKRIDNQFLSIFYKAAYSSKYSAHPSELVYTTNIDMKKVARLRLKDLVTLNSDFVNSLREWDFTTAGEVPEDWNIIIKEIIGGMSEEELLQGLKAADQIGSDNIWGIYSYLTSNKLGVSISVPNFVGDHVEFEKYYSELEPFLNEEFTW